MGAKNRRILIKLNGDTLILLEHCDHEPTETMQLHVFGKGYIYIRKERLPWLKNGFRGHGSDVLAKDLSTDSSAWLRQFDLI